MNRQFRHAAALAALAFSASPGAGQRPLPGPASLVKVEPWAVGLAQERPITGPDGWVAIPDNDAWRALTRATPTDRQSARWRLARSYIAQGRGIEAEGVLATMLKSEPDLGFVAAFRLARGAALTLAGRSTDAIEQLAAPELAGNAEACAWRMRAEPVTAQTLECGLPAVNARALSARRPFLLAMAEHALANGRGAAVRSILAALPESDAAANILRARATLMDGDEARARFLLSRARSEGHALDHARAELTALKLLRMPPRERLARLEKLRFGWRGDEIEKESLGLLFNTRLQQGDRIGALAAGAILHRYFDLGNNAGPMLIRLQDMLAGLLGTDSELPLEQAGGLVWVYREFLPAGGRGDLLVMQLADRMASAGLFARAAQLIRYQMDQRAVDIAKGPLSVTAAEFSLRGGDAQGAIAAIRSTAGIAYPEDIAADRRRVEAVALARLGRIPQAQAMLAGVPGGAALSAEMLWQARDWRGFAGASRDMLPAARTLSESEAGLVLRHAIALAMVGDAEGLTGLDRRYGTVFSGRPEAALFEALTGNTREPEAITRAMAKLRDTSEPDRWKGLLTP